MLTFLLNLICQTVTSFSNLISQLIFLAAANLVVVAIQAFKVPGEAAKVAIEETGELVKSCAEYLLQFASEAISGLISAGFDLLKEGASGSVAAVLAGLGGLVELTRKSVDGLFDALVEAFSGFLQGFLEMIWTVIVDLWSNCMEAMRYVAQNA
ncbi:hypothetical protein NMG60_11034472 [Bertholletia excelsa]